MKISSTDSANVCCYFSGCGEKVLTVLKHEFLQKAGFLHCPYQNQFQNVGPGWCLLFSGCSNVTIPNSTCPYRVPQRKSAKRRLPL